MSRYALLGEKISHSFSPILHNYIYKKLNLNDTYELISASKDEVNMVIDKVRSGYYKGINVTIPYKALVMDYLDYIDPKAIKIGAVNTIKNENGKLVGYNTDYYGFKGELEKYNINPLNGKTYVLGNGGAAKAVITYLDDINANYEIVARNPHEFEVIGFEEFEKRNDQYLIINTTPIGMFPNVDNLPISKTSIIKASYCVDLIYNPLQTEFVKEAKNGYNGLYMLVMQGIKAFEIWNDKKIKIADEIYNHILEERHE